MNIRCLIIDRDPIFGEKLGNFITAFRDDFQVQTVTNVIEAIEAITSAEFSLVLCEPSLADIKRELVASIIDKKPPVSLLLTDQDDSVHLNGLQSLSCFKGFIPRPVRSADLAGKVVLALDDFFYQGNVLGVSCIPFIQIIEQECSDCILKVIKDKEEVKGLLFFKKGMLLDAICDSTAALEAVKRVLSWEKVDIELYNICPLKKNRINVKVATLILQAIKNQEPSERPLSVTEREISSKNTNKPVGGLAGLFLKKARNK